MALVARGSDLGQALSRGTVLADDGNLYENVQEAENAASDWIFIGPGTFSEAMTIDTAGLAVYGSGRDTLIDGGTTGDAISVTASNVYITNLSVQTTAGGGNNNEGINATGVLSSLIIDSVWVRDSDSDGVVINGDNSGDITDCMLISVIVESADGNGFSIADSDRCIISDCIIDGIGSEGILFTGCDDVLTVDNIILNASEGIELSLSNDHVIVGNRVHNATNEGIFIRNTDCLVANNRVSDCGTDIKDFGTDTLLHGNRTGAAS